MQTTHLAEELRKNLFTRKFHTWPTEHACGKSFAIQLLIIYFEGLQIPPPEEKEKKKAKLN